MCCARRRGARVGHGRVGKGALRRALNVGYVSGAPCPRVLTPRRSFTEMPGDLAQITAPVGGQHSAFDVAMKAAVRPIAHARHMPMLNGIEMDVVHVALEVRVIMDHMLPVAALPQPALAPGNLALRWNCLGRKSAREAALDQTPAQRI